MRKIVTAMGLFLLGIIAPIFLNAQATDTSIDFLLVGLDSEDEAKKLYCAARDGKIKHPVIVVGEQAFINFGKKKYDSMKI